jgi:AcrR family transcriptional regulator
MAAKRITPGPRDERGVLAARILDVARASFAEHGFAGTTVRNVARAADVDPALVYHYYGSKDGLLDAATNPPQTYAAEIASAWAGEGNLGDQLVRRMLNNWENPAHAPILRAILQIAGNEPATREKLRRIIENVQMGPASQALPAEERLARAALVASQMMGVAFMRFIWRIEPIASMSIDDLVAAVGPTIQRYLDDPALAR